jgi:hypothetical protein
MLSQFFCAAVSRYALFCAKSFASESFPMQSLAALRGTCRIIKDHGGTGEKRISNPWVVGSSPAGRAGTSRLAIGNSTSPAKPPSNVSREPTDDDVEPRCTLQNLDPCNRTNTSFFRLPRSVDRCPWRLPELPTPAARNGPAFS